MRSLVPERFEIDVFEGTAYVGLVPFRMQAVRPSWCPRALEFAFPETNVRTYVLCEGRPGVYFFSLEAASRIAVWAARKFWSLPYHYARMRVEEGSGELLYDSQREDSASARLRVRCRLGDMLGPLDSESLDYFLLERYLLFVERAKQILVGQVAHQPYPAQRAEVLELEDGLLAAAGIQMSTPLPRYVHFAAGVDVEVFSLTTI